MQKYFAEHGIGIMPKLVRLEPDYPNLIAVAFECMKVLPAEFMLDRAAEEKQIDANTKIVETTSGNFAMGLGLACHKRGLKLFLVGDPAISPHWKLRLEELGAKVFLIDHPDEEGSYQKSRLRLVERLIEQHANSFCPSQYHNPNNPLAYGGVAGMLVEALGGVDALVGTVGSGGSTCGVTHSIRTLAPELQLIGVDTFRSVLFGQLNGERELRGLGNSIMPANLQHELFDQVHWIDAGMAYRAARDLWRRHRLFQGPTSGAAFAIARWYARKYPDAQVAVILPDDGNRYVSTVFDDKWMGIHGHADEQTPEDPVTVYSPREATGPWCRIDWGRRKLSEVLAADTNSEVFR